MIDMDIFISEQPVQMVLMYTVVDMMTRHTFLWAAAVNGYGTVTGKLEKTYPFVQINRLWSAGRREEKQRVSVECTLHCTCLEYCNHPH